MNFETIKKNNKSKIIIGVITLLALTSVVMFVSTRAKYRSIQSVKLANGTINYSAPDLKLAIKVSEDGETYTSRTDIPTSGYTFNTEKSKCRIPTSTLTGENAPVAEGVTIEYTDGKVNVLGVTQKDTRCYIYFDKVLNQTSLSIIAAIEKSTSYKTGTPTFANVATGAETEANNGIYKVSDGMYGGYSYYWRGAATTNHVIFDSKCWRIVRINGDKTIRLIYNGTPTGNNCTQDANSAAVIMGSSNAEKYYATSDGQWNNPSYVGWIYTLNTHKTLSGTDSNAKKQTELWYNNNISTVAKEKVDSNGKFCGDRNIGTPPAAFGWNSIYTTSWTTGTGNSNRFSYKSVERIYGNIPTLSCDAEDTYSLSIGAITADEVMFAGGKTENNTSYYLNAGVNYWTMSPSYWADNAGVFYVGAGGYLNGTNVDVHSTLGLRPVINLRSDVTFNAGSIGTQNNPYIVQ